MRHERWQSWAIGLIFGAVVGAPIASFGMPLLILSSAFVAFAFVTTRSIALLSGAVTGIGGIWLALLIRAQLACDAFDAAPNQECKSSGVEPWFVFSAVVLGIGLLLGGVAWRRRGDRRERSVNR